MSDIINRFTGENYYLSNFYEAPISYDGRTYKNNEAAFQSMKCKNKADRNKFCDLNPSEAKHLGKSVVLRKDWEQVKVKIMKDIVSIKFNQNPDLMDKLISTNDAYLEEGNTWGDKIWGCYYPVVEQHPVFDNVLRTLGSKDRNEMKTVAVAKTVSYNGPKRSVDPVNGVGKNLLGIILMDVRKELIIMTNKEKTQLWNTLSNDAKSVLEWVYNPRTGTYNKLDLNIGKEFFVKGMDKGILITRGLMDEIITYVNKDPELTCDVEKYQVFVREDKTINDELNANELEKE